MRQIQYKIIGDGYEVTNSYVYYSKRYNRSISIPVGFFSDGATSAPDIDTDAWIVHDHICRYAEWDDGTRIDNWTASTVLGDILWRDGFKGRSMTWWIATFLFGGGAARDNGMRRVNLL